MSELMLIIALIVPTSSDYNTALLLTNGNNESMYYVADSNGFLEGDNVIVDLDSRTITLVSSNTETYVVESIVDFYKFD